MIDQLEPHWKTVEYVVALLEKTLTPEATVEHDVKLPELATGTLRQCDVVIRTGAPPRTTLTIVEVQARGRKVEVSDYEGWCRKREKLGAQHLICVSSSGFPESVTRDALALGDSVRLMTLCQADEFPGFLQCRSFIFDVQYRYVREARIIWSDHPALYDASVNAATWRVEGSKNPVSLDSLITAAWEARLITDLDEVSHGSGVRIRTFRVPFRPPNGRVWSESNKGRVYIAEAIVQETLKASKESKEVKVLAYEQKFFDGVVGWLVTAHSDFDGRPMCVQMACVPNSDGTTRITMGEIQVPGVRLEKCEFHADIGGLEKH
jgi:hypothetical protein